jgi:tetratricopeptide (TPR) repeat protein
MNWRDINSRWLEPARQAWREGKPDLAARLLEDGLRATGNDGYLALSYASMLEHQGHRDHAKRMYELALARLPLPRYKQQAREGLERLRTSLAPPPLSHDEMSSLSPTPPTELRREGWLFWKQVLIGVLATVIGGLVLAVITCPGARSGSQFATVSKKAEAAKATMLLNIDQGERLFQELLQDYPGDGMVYFRRAEAYEAHGELRLAAEDYRRALALFPKEEWKAQARAGLRRVNQ